MDQTKIITGSPYLRHGHCPLPELDQLFSAKSSENTLTESHLLVERAPKRSERGVLREITHRAENIEKWLAGYKETLKRKI